MNKGFLILLAVTLTGATSWAEKGMTFKEYQVALSAAMQREKDAKESLAGEQVQIENLQREVSDLGARISATQQEMFAQLNITQADADALESGIAESRMELNSILSLSDEEVIKSKERIAQVKTRVTAIQAQPAARLGRFSGSLQELSALCAEADQRAVSAKEAVALAQKTAKQKPARSSPSVAYTGDGSDTYTVQPYRDSKDCLWNISERLYNDFMQWESIYQANRDQIRNPDIIRPGQVLKLPK